MHVADALTWLWRARRKRITDVIVQAATVGPMIVHRACGVNAARTAARIHAAFVDARPIAGTVGALGALGSTVGRSSDVVGRTRADGTLFAGAEATVRVGAAWRRIARIDGDGRNGVGWMVKRFRISKL